MEKPPMEYRRVSSPIFVPFISKCNMDPPMDIDSMEMTIYIILINFTLKYKP